MAEEGNAKEEKTKKEAESKKTEEKQAEKPKEEKKEAHPAPESAGDKKHKKISRMKPEEVERELKAIQEKMGGFQSGFARHLLARKKELAESRR